MSPEAQTSPQETARLDRAGAISATEAEAVVDYHQCFTLNNADRDRLLEALASDEGPNEALVQAAHSFDKRYDKR